MATIHTLNRSILEMTMEDAIQHILLIRERRFSKAHISKKTRQKQESAKKNVTTRKSKEAKVAEALTQLTPAQLEYIKAQLMGG